MKLSLLLLSLALFVLACPGPQAPGPTPVNPPDTDLCGAMCLHIGPKDKGGLGCEEGEAVYDSDVAGPPDVPNVSCEEFCKTTQNVGAFLNPRCVAKVKTCEEIELARTRTVCP